MKNLKNMVAATGLMAILGMGAVTANAGILISDAANQGGETQCQATTNDTELDVQGIIIASITGILISDGANLSTGILISDKTACGGGGDSLTSTGILISD